MRMELAIFRLGLLPGIGPEALRAHVEIVSRRVAHGERHRSQLRGEDFLNQRGHDLVLRGIPHAAEFAVKVHARKLYGFQAPADAVAHLEHVHLFRAIRGCQEPPAGVKAGDSPANDGYIQLQLWFGATIESLKGYPFHLISGRLPRIQLPSGGNWSCRALANAPIMLQCQSPKVFLLQYPAAAGRSL